MREPRFLLEHGATPLERRLLEAGGREQPSAAARAAALSALGLGGSVALAATEAAGAKGSALAAVSSGTLSKWWLVLGAVGAVGGSTFVLWPAHDDPPQARSAAAVAPVESAAREVEAPVEAAGEAQSEGEPARAPAKVQPRSSPPAAPSSGAVSIQGQIDLIDRARRALRARRPAEAMTALTEYRKRYPQGVLAQEAELLRIEALLQQGNRAAAERWFEQYQARYPNGPLTARVRRLLGR